MRTSSININSTRALQKNMSTNAILSIGLLLLGFSAAAAWIYEKHRLRKQALAYLRTEYLSKIHLGQPFSLEQLMISKKISFVASMLLDDDQIFRSKISERASESVEAAACVLLSRAFSVVISCESESIKTSNKVLYCFFSYYQTTLSILLNANGLTEAERNGLPFLIATSFPKGTFQRASTLNMADIIDKDLGF
ncbi:MAG: hypothetical protein ACLR3J_06780 [Sutterella wadsworthensis]|jgi:hypothetical protein